MPLSNHLEDTWAILIGVREFENREEKLPAIPAVKKNLADLGNLFKDKIIGIHEDRIISIENPTRDEMLDCLKKNLYSGFKANTLIVYYVGHGILFKENHEEHLYLTIYNTQYDSSDHALSFRKLYDMTYQKASNVLYILDCCNSGNTLQDGKLEKLFATDKKIAMLTATKPDNNAKASGKDNLYTAFTGNLIELLREGYGNEDTLTTLKVFEGLTEKFKKQGVEDKYLPWHHNFSNEPFHFAYNRPAYSQPEPSSVTPLYLLISLDEKSINKNKKTYLFQAWLAKGRDSPQPVRLKNRMDADGQVITTLDNVPILLRELIDEKGEDIRQNKDNLTIEFFLPTKLLNRDVEAWIPRGNTYPLSVIYPVVVRPLERFWVKKKLNKELNKEPNTESLNLLHGYWDNDKLKSNVDQWAIWLESEDVDLKPLAIIRYDKKIFFGLNFVPRPGFLGSKLVRPAVPIALWIRKKGANLCRQELCNCQLAELPRYILKKRTEIWESSGKHTGHLSLLWDDPDRIPEEWKKLGGP